MDREDLDYLIKYKGVDYMKSAKEIIARAVILLCLSDRCALEKAAIGGKSYSKKQREEQKNAIYQWLQNKGYTNYMTKSETQLFEQEVDSGYKNKILAMQVQYEAIEPCLWSLGLVNELSSYDQFVLTDFHPVLQIGLQHDIAKVLDLCNLRTEEEIYIQNEIAMLWNWRIVEWNNPIFQTQTVKDIIVNIFGKQYEKVLAKIQQRSSNQSDFMVKNKLLKDLNKQEISQIECIAKWRYHAFEWIIGNDLWDEVELNS